MLNFSWISLQISQTFARLEAILLSLKEFQTNGKQSKLVLLVSHKIPQSWEEEDVCSLKFWAATKSSISLPSSYGLFSGMSSELVTWCKVCKRFVQFFRLAGPVLGGPYSPTLQGRTWQLLNHTLEASKYFPPSFYSEQEPIQFPLHLLSWRFWCEIGVGFGGVRYFCRFYVVLLMKIFMNLQCMKSINLFLKTDKRHCMPHLAV